VLSKEICQMCINGHRYNIHARMIIKWDFRDDDRWESCFVSCPVCSKPFNYPDGVSLVRRVDLIPTEGCLFQTEQVFQWH
jgi:hypothetical protein